MKKLSRDEMKNLMGGIALGGACVHVGWPCEAAYDPYCICFLGQLGTRAHGN
jgi:hypothetical protein